MAGRGRGADSYVLCLKWFLFAFNVISLATAIVIFTLGLWIRYDWDFKHYVHELQMYDFWTGDYILIICAAFVMATSLLGCCGAMMENPAILGLNGVILIVMFILELTGLAYILDHGVLWSKITWWLREKFYTLINVADYDARSARILRIIQENIGCCGSYSSLDYINVNKPVPIECRDPITGNEYQFGCYERVSRYLEERSGPIAGVALFLAVLQILGIIACFTMRHYIKKLQKRGADYGPVRVKH